MVHNKRKVPVYLYFYENMITFNMACIAWVHRELIDIHSSAKHLCIHYIPMI